MTILVNTTSREVAEPVVKAFAGQVKFIQTAPPPVPFCALVSEVPPHLCQIGDYSSSRAPFVDLRAVSVDEAIVTVRDILGKAGKLPSVLEMGRSALGDIIKWSAVKFGRCDEEQINARLSECRVCPYWDPEAFRGTGRCKKCGCSTWAKIKLKSASCPDGRWGEITVEE